MEIREVTQGLLIWTPGDKPTQATSYTYGGFRTIADGNRFLNRNELAALSHRFISGDCHFGCPESVFQGHRWLAVFLNRTQEFATIS
ncbi:MAG: hypothetical protein R2688_10205 [Fimbriimonadaceae bacterium]